MSSERSVVRAIVVGGLVVGVIDGIAATLSSGGVGRVFRYVASGLVGRSAFEGGIGTVALGIALHFVVATLAATTFVLGSRRFPGLVRQPVRWGLAYGVVVYFFMRYVVIPISAAPSLPFSLAGLARGLAIHLVCVGLPIALVARLLAPPPASMR